MKITRNRSSKDTTNTSEQTFASASLSEDPLHAQLLPSTQRAKDFDKKTLVLDLDETLVHTEFNKPHLKDSAKVIMKMNDGTTAYVMFRPGVEDFLKRMAKCYEIVIFTASLEAYAEHILMRLDYKLKFGFSALFREDCTFKNGTFVKDLSSLGRNLKNVVMVDNVADSYML